MRDHHVCQSRRMKPLEWRIRAGPSAATWRHRFASRLLLKGCFAGWLLMWIVAASELPAADAWRPAQTSELQSPVPRPARRPLEMEDWPALLNGLAADPLTNSISRLVVVRALFETGRLPEDQFSWLHCPGPDIFSTADLKQYSGAIHIAETLLELGHLNAAERLAFDSLELEGESPLILRTLARLHVVKGLPVAADIFLNRLQAYPEHSTWAIRLRSALATNSPAAADPFISRIRANLITRDEIARGLTTERLLRLALEANSENRMAFQFLIAHYLLERRLPNALRMLASSPLAREGLLPRHYAEALLLQHDLHPDLSPSALLPRVPPAVLAKFQGFKEMMSHNAGSPEQLQSQAWSEFGNTYWYYHFFGPRHQTSHPSKSGSS